MKKEEIFFISDLHIPYEDKRKVRRTLSEIAEEKPKVVVLGGDILDFYQISRFDKDPERIGKLQQELNQYYSFMKKLRTVHKGGLIYLIGNHETRLKKYLMRNPELYGLDFLKLDYVLKQKEFNFHLCYEWEHKGFLFTHGIKANQYSAAGELKKNGVSGISGHKHNHNVASHTNRRASDVWITAPCLCDVVGQEYTHNPDWQTGYVKVKFDSRKMNGYEVKLL